MNPRNLKKQAFHPDRPRALVTGGAGFLGSHLCDKLLSNGWNVLCLDDLTTGQKCNLAHLSGNPRFHFVVQDITAPFLAQAERIYNLACPASPIHYQNDPVRTTRTNIFGAANMLELAKSCKARIFQASTSEVYGDAEICPQSETYWGKVNPIGVRACYDEGKRCAESLFFDYYRQFNLDVRIARVFNTYGPRMRPDDGRVISNFIVRALRNEDIEIFGDGTQTRSFCYVDDMIEGINRLVDDNTGFCGPLNLGSPVQITIRELAVLIVELTGSSSKLVCRSLPQDDPKQRCPDITLAKELLKWAPSISLEEGLKKTIAYFADL